MATQAEDGASTGPAKEPDYEDITELLTAAAEEMAVGQMIHHPKFTLYEAMSSTESMDAKMDSGVGAEKALKVDEAMHLSVLPKTSELPGPAVLFIMDKLLTAEILWYDGYTVLQTLFSCLYLHKLTTLQDNPMLFAYAQCLLRRCHIVREMLLRASCFDEEDFVSATFGLSLCEGISEKSCLDRITTEENALESKLKTADDSEKPLISAFLARMRLCKALYQLHSQMDLPQCVGLTQAKETGKKAADLLQLVVESASLAEPLAADSSIFQPELSKRFVSSTPPRPLKWHDFAKTAQVLQKQIADLVEVCDITNYTTLNELQRIFLDFRLRGADLIARSRMLASAFWEMKVHGKVPLTDALIAHATEFGVPKSYFNESMNQLLIFVSKFVMRAYRIWMNNPSRQRRKLNFVADDASYITGDADQLDVKNLPPSAKNERDDAPHYLVYWTTDWAIKFMIQHLQLGFELEIYDTQEFPMIWWYLDNLWSLRNSNQLYVLRYNNMQQLKVKLLRNRKNTALQHQVQAAKTEPPPPTPHMLEIEAHHHLTRGMLKLIAVYLQQKKWPQPELALGTTESRFWRRFAPFLKLSQPRVFPFTRYDGDFLGQLPKLPLSGLLNMTVESFTACQATITKLLQFEQKPSALLAKELRSLLRIAITNGVRAGQLASSNILKDPNSKIAIDFGSHKYFPVIELK